MQILGAILAILAMAPVALFTAGYMSDSGMLGSCFEGACGYTAMFLAFPVLWVVMSIIAVLIVLSVMQRRRR